MLVAPSRVLVYIYIIIIGTSYMYILKSLSKNDGRVPTLMWVVLSYSFRIFHFALIYPIWSWFTCRVWGDLSNNNY